LFRIARIAPLALALAFAFTAQASAASNLYLATGTGDSGGACQEFAVVEGFTYFRCDSVRAAVDAANAHPNSANDSGDVVWLQSDQPYTVNQPLTLTDSVTVYGRGPRTSTIRGAGARVFVITPGVEANLARLTIAGGNASTADGGNILNHGDLFLLNARVTGGVASRGGGIANTGTGSLLIANSLVDHNSVSFQGFGGGIYDEGDLVINNSTLAFNEASGEAGIGGGIYTSTAADLFAVTIAHNESLNGAAGIAGGSQTIHFYGSLVAENRRATTLANCSGIINDDSQTNLADNGCFELTGNPGLSTDLVNRGGDTDVLTITPGGAAKDFVTPCIGANDQRGAPRNSSGTCDAGAFEEGVEAPPIDSSAFPEPAAPPVITPPVFTPPPPPVVTSQEPTPVVNQIVVAKEVSGRVRIKLRGTNRFIELDATQGIPVGSTVDTKQGIVELTSIPKAGAAPEKAQFRQGIFLLTQKAGITDLKLTEALSCPKRGAKAAAAKPKSRKLWGKGSGKFRTTGNYSAATVRGTEWLVQDTCSGTLTRVTQGVVAVRDTVKKKTILVRGPRGRYTAKPRK
jgi:hypothetical protein